MNRIREIDQSTPEVLRTMIEGWIDKAVIDGEVCHWLYARLLAETPITPFPEARNTPPPCAETIKGDVQELTAVLYQNDVVNHGWKIRVAREAMAKKLEELEASAP